MTKFSESPLRAALGEILFPTDVVSPILGVSVGNLALWAKAKVLEPTVAARRRGVARQYSFSDLVRARLLTKCLDCGLASKLVERSILPAIPSHAGPDVLMRLSVVADNHEMLGLVDGPVDSSRYIRPGQAFLMVLPLRDLVCELEDKLIAHLENRGHAAA